ncbi:MAG: DNA primase [Proteobacteria bacterium]|nr:DNA primase [Pseudomonadota bacterium]HQR04104.1 DNA primase [Rhodocyclaceae bacterium]
MIPESFIQELLGRVDIVDVVERHVPLRKAGANYSACCPFHSEKTPSFTVSPAKQFYHCFGCGAHGSAIGFVMQYSGLGFVEAVEDLASHIGLAVPREHGVQRAAATARKAPLTELLARAARFYQEQLKASPKAIDYLKRRGLTGAIAARFGLGYAPDAWQGLEQVFTDYHDAALLECGLVIVNDQNRRYDRFRDRIMFPILDQKGNVIGFGGRVIGEGEPKYLNSPETPVFEKGRELYGLVQARKAIHQDDTVIIVEGYMDVVGLAQLGIENVVASLGTATTGVHVQKLLRQASRVIFCFDRDRAGDNAARRAMEASLEHLADGKRVEILQMPGNQDPDEFIREHGAEAFRRLLGSATQLSEFLVRQVRKSANLGTAEGRALLVQEAHPLLQKISAAAPVLRVQITQTIAGLARLSQAELEARCGLKPLARSWRPPPSAGTRHVAVSPLRTLLRHVVKRPVRAARLPLHLIDGDDPVGATLHAIAEALEHGELSIPSVGLLMEFFRGSPHEALIGEYAAPATLDNAEEDGEETEFDETLEQMRRRSEKEEFDRLNARLHLLDPAEKRRWVELLATRAARESAHRGDPA